MSDLSPPLTREQFLNDLWNRYPQAENDWYDVAAAQGAEGELVAGRIFRDPSGRGWKLTSAGCTLSLRFADGIAWLKAQKKHIKFITQFLLDGDWVCVRLGAPTPDGVREADAILLLAPALEAPPSDEKFDVRRSRLWAEYLEALRSFFVSRGFIEAMTPTLVQSPGTEPFLEPFSTSWKFGSTRREFFLPTSPEFHLKKMLTRGWTKVFELKTCFRNGEISEHHQPEFLMLEWYRAFANLDSIAKDVGELVASLSRRFGREAVELRRVTMAELFQTRLGFNLTPATTREELVRLAQGLNISIRDDDSWDDIFFRVFLEKIEGDLGADGPLLVRGYPPSQAALSRIGPDGFADRFEVYWRGLELANAFHELNDPDENEKRFRDDARKKLELGRRSVPVDEELIAGLKTGMPPSGGIALGVERLFMALFDLPTIAEARAFPIKIDSETC
jgi:lysyl-tRNA synthetase class 2